MLIRGFFLNSGVRKMQQILRPGLFPKLPDLPKDLIVRIDPHKIQFFLNLSLHLLFPTLNLLYLLLDLLLIKLNPIILLLFAKPISIANSQQSPTKRTSLTKLKNAL